MYSLQTRRKKSRTMIHVISTLAVGSVMALSLWVMLFATGAITLGGVPYSVLMKFWQDAEARDAYFRGDGRALHDRLGDMDIEYEIKKYYRPRISDPVELDQHIHQILFDRTGYVGENYRVNAQRKLVLKDVGKAIEIEGCPNC